MEHLPAPQADLLKMGLEVRKVVRAKPIQEPVLRYKF
jgi:hypothetical protein